MLNLLSRERVTLHMDIEVVLSGSNPAQSDKRKPERPPKQMAGRCGS